MAILYFVTLNTLGHVAFVGARMATTLFALELGASAFTAGLLLSLFAALPMLLSVATGRLIDWECGARDERTFRRLFERLARWKVRLFCSDSYVVYPLVLAVGNHHQGKGQTVALERNNGQQRHWTAALRRRSIVVSKSLAMPLAHLKDAPACCMDTIQANQASKMRTIRI